MPHANDAFIVIFIAVVVVIFIYIAVGLFNITLVAAACYFHFSAHDSKNSEMEAVLFLCRVFAHCSSIRGGTLWSLFVVVHEKQFANTLLILLMRVTKDTLDTVCILDMF